MAVHCALCPQPWSHTVLPLLPLSLPSPSCPWLKANMSPLPAFLSPMCTQSKLCPLFGTAWQHAISNSSISKKTTVFSEKSRT